MAPTRSKKRKSAESQSSMERLSSQAPALQATIKKMEDPIRTPTGRSPIRKAPIRLTVYQKQALIDNLQLEITERARKLRAQYMMQAQGLRTRIEIRVNRIPMALRKANMGELFLKHAESVKQHNATTNSTKAIRPITTSPSKSLIQEAQRNARQSPSPMRPAKRLSDEITDKENDDLSNPRKRAKAPQLSQNNTRAKLQPEQVLSPRSANSRTLPKSPARPALSPGKSYLARPISPLKPMGPPGGAAGILTNMVEKAKSTRATAARKITASSSGSSAATAGRGKKAPRKAPTPKVGKGRASNSSQSTDTSSGTTLVMKPAPMNRSPVKKTVMSTIKGMGSTAAKKPTVATKAAPTRVLRKRT